MAPCLRRSRTDRAGRWFPGGGGWGLTAGRTRGLLGAGNDLRLHPGAGFMGVLS